MKRRGKATRIKREIRKGDSVHFCFDGQPIKAYRGETIATALLSAGHLISRTINSKPLGIYCNMGVCHSCVMTVNGIASVRICKTQVSEGCRVESQHFQKDHEDEL